MIDYTATLIPDSTYHIYNRAINKDKLFLRPENYLFFLKRYRQYISPIADTFCYCLMPNHFHIMVRFKNENEIKGIIVQDNLSAHYSLQFSHLFNSYSKAFNKQEKRMGGLFMSPFKRKKMKDTAHMINVVRYIHFNPVVAGLCGKPERWRYSSYHAILSDAETVLNRKELLELFDGKENFVLQHRI